MRPVFAALSTLVGIAIGIAGAHLLEKPDTGAVALFFAPPRILMSGNFSAINEANHTVIFNAIDPYTLTDTISLQLEYGTTTQILLGTGDLQHEVYNTTEPIGDIQPGEAGSVYVGRASGPLQAYTIIDARITNADL